MAFSIHTVWFSVLLTSVVVANGVQAQTCPLAVAAPASLSGPLAQGEVRTSASPDLVVFRSKLDIDDDGNPHAYHRGLALASQRDPGLDQICNGMSVLEMNGATLRNKYGPAGSGGDLTSGTDAERLARAHACKKDYVDLRDAGFPPCGPGHLCGYFFGIEVEDRPCGYPYGSKGAGNLHCGVPVRQKDSAGAETDFYLTTNTLQRPGAPGRSQVQADYADALEIPFIVMPGDQKLPTKNQWKAGDLAAVIWHGQVVYAVVGDSGPQAQIGEASRALLTSLGHKGAIELKDPVTTVLLPGTRDWIASEPWPLDARRIEAHARAALAKVPGGMAALRTCAGLEALDVGPGSGS